MLRFVDLLYVDYSATHRFFLLYDQRFFLCGIIYCMYFNLYQKSIILLSSVHYTMKNRKAAQAEKGCLEPTMKKTEEKVGFVQKYTLIKNKLKKK